MTDTQFNVGNVKQLIVRAHPGFSVPSIQPSHSFAHQPCPSTIHLPTLIHTHTLTSPNHPHTNHPSIHLPAPSPYLLSHPPTHPSIHVGLSILDLTSIDNDVLSLQNVFKSWLHDCGTDSEHLHLALPPSHAHSGEQAVTLKCDLQERVLDPSSLTALGQHFVRAGWLA